MPAWPSYLTNGHPQVVRADGCYLHLNDGTTLLDACGGAIVTNIGHGRQEVVDEIAKASLNTGYVVPIWSTLERHEIVTRLREHWLPEGCGNIHLTCSGSEAVESALIATVLYHYAMGRPEKTRFVGRDISYHGTTIAALGVGGHELRKKGIKHALGDHIVIPTPSNVRETEPNAVEYYVDAFKETLLREDPNTIAALILEPIVGASGGAIVPPDGYMEAIFELCNENDILVISDEVMTGFGRTGKRFGYQHWNVQPDILLGGKGLAGGYAPVTMVACRDHIAQVIDDAGLNVMFHTFSAHTGACAASSKVLEIIDREGLVNRCEQMGDLLAQKLQGAFSNHPHVAECRGKGLLQGLEFVRDRETMEPFETSSQVSAKIVNHMYNNGVSVYRAGNGIVRDAILIGPPFIVKEDQLTDIVEAVSIAVDEVIPN